MSRSSPDSGNRTEAGRAPRTASRRPQARFSSAARLRRHSDFDRVYRTGQRQSSGNLAVYFLRREAPGGTAGARVGFTVGRALGPAVERNRIKRRLREAARLNLGRIAAAVDVVINPRKSVLKMDFAQLVDEVGKLFAGVEQKLAAADARASAAPRQRR